MKNEFYIRFTYVCKTYVASILHLIKPLFIRISEENDHCPYKNIKTYDIMLLGDDLYE